MQDRLMAETRDLIADGIVERAERESVREEAELMRERLSRLTTPIGVSPHEPTTARRRGRMRA